jgi:hypothetical protein
MHLLEVVCLAQQLSLRPGEIRNRDLALTICALCTRLVVNTSIQINLGIHGIHGLAAHKTFLRHGGGSSDCNDADNIILKLEANCFWLFYESKIYVFMC